MNIRMLWEPGAVRHWALTAAHASGMAQAHLLASLRS